MNIILEENDLGFLAASYLKRRLKETGGKMVLGLPTGGTMEGFYKHLVDFYKAGQISFKDVITFNLDEYTGLSATSPQSYRYYMDKHLFDYVDIKRGNIHFPDADNENYEKACKDYEERITAAGGIDLLFGGVGRNGHIAFNESGTPFDIPTHRVKLAESTRKANARFFKGGIEDVPYYALTMGMGTILKAKEIIILASGESKAEAVYHAVQGNITTLWPVSALKEHKNSFILADAKALSLVSKSVLEEYKNCSLGQSCLNGQTGTK